MKKKRKVFLLLPKEIYLKEPFKIVLWVKEHFYIKMVAGFKENLIKGNFLKGSFNLGLVSLFQDYLWTEFLLLLKEFSLIMKEIKL